MALSRAPAVCVLAPFPGGRGYQEAIFGSIRINADRSRSSSAVINAAWCVVLHLYTGLQQLSFETTQQNGHRRVVVYAVEDDSTLGDCLSQMTQDEQHSDVQDTTVEYNTSTLSNPESSLGEGIQVALRASRDDFALVYRLDFMSDVEASNIGATFAHALARCVDVAGRQTLIRSAGISHQDMMQIVKWNASIPLSKKEYLIHARFSRVAQKFEDAEAICAWDGSMTYGELETASNALAHTLTTKGVASGSWVLFCFRKSRWAIVSILAILKAGGAFIAIDPRYPEERVRQIIHTSKARHALVGADLDTIALLSKADPELCILDATRQNEQHQDLVHQKIEVSPNGPAFSVFTSGSTGTPKGVILTHTNACSAAEAYAKTIGTPIGGGRRILHFSSYTFDVSMAEVWATLLYGATLCIPSETERIDDLQGYILRSRSNWAALTPTVSRLLDAEAVKQCLETLMLLGEPIRESDIDSFLDAGIDLYNVYGPAENALITTAATISKGRASNVGYGVNTRTWVVDFANKSLVPIGAIGELILEGIHVGAGYLNDPERTRISFLEEIDWIPPVASPNSLPRRFYRSGDLARYCEDGSLVCVGRADTQVKLGGQRVELSDVESHLQLAPGVRTAAAFVPKTGVIGGRLTALIQLKEHGTEGGGNEANTGPSSFIFCDPQVTSGITESIRRSLPSFMIPSFWILVDNFPTSSSQKLDRKSLQARLESLTQDDYIGLLQNATHENAPMEKPFEAPRSAPDLDLLCQCCSQVLNIPRDNIPVGKSFVGLGGDSITAMQVASTMKRIGNKTISVKDLLSSSSLVVAAQYLRSLSYEAVSHIFQPDRRYRLSPIQKLFLETAPTSDTWNHYHQSVCLKLRELRDAQQVEAALVGVVRRHPMLRALFGRSSSGKWRQYVSREEAGSSPLQTFSRRLSPEQRANKMLQARKSLNITSGPVFRAQLFTGDPEDGVFLFLVAHHLVVDLVSWRIILSELEFSLTIGLQHSEIDPTKQTLSSDHEPIPYLAWTEMQSEAAQDWHPNNVIPSSHKIPEPDFEYWALSPNENVYRDVVELRLQLGPEMTSNILYDCHHSLRTEPVDIFLASIFLSFKRAFPDREIPTIFNEGHGREPWNEGHDLSRTVGWFTTMSPVHVENIKASDAMEVVRRVKDYRQQTPGKGFQYFSSKYLNEQGIDAFKEHLPTEILFNYEGRYQALEKDDSLLIAENWHAGEALEDQQPELKRFSLFELSFAILPDGQLHFTATWNSRAKHQNRINLWLKSLLTAAMGEIVTSLMISSRQYTITDLKQLGVTEYDEVHAVTSSVQNIPGVRSIEDVEDIYPGSPIQDALALSLSRADDAAYEIEYTIEVSRNGGEIEIERLVAAWKDIVARHAVLRTVVLEACIPGASVIHQVVLKEYDPDFVLLQAKDGEHALETLRKYPSYRQKSLFADQRPPHRLIICSNNDGSAIIKLQVNHIIFDGMSMEILLKDLGEAYDEQTCGEKPIRGLRTPFADFVRYIRDQPRRDASMTYWKSYLADAEPCLFPSLLDSAATAEEEAALRQERGLMPVKLSVNHAELHHSLARLGFTLPAFFQVLWALLLRRYTGSDKSVFGYLTSGRDAPVDGIDGAVGPFIAMMVCFIHLGQDATLSMEEIIRQVQKSSMESAEHQGSSLAEIHNALDLPSGTALFNSGVSFMSKTFKDRQIEHKWPLIFDEIETLDPTEFDLSLIVETLTDGAISLHLAYRPSAIGKNHVENIAAAVGDIVSELAGNLQKTPNEMACIGENDLRQIWTWNRIVIEPSQECAHEIFARKVILHPDKEAIFSLEGTLTYKELDELSTRLAKRLVSLGVGVEKMVPVCFEKSMWTVVTILAILKAGGCFVLLDPANPEARLWAIIKEIEAFLLICSPVTSKLKGFKASARDRSPALCVLEVDSAFIRDLPSLGRNEYSSSPICRDVSPDHAMYVVFTSGTTGTPKGAVATHRAVASGLYNHAEACGMISIGSDLRSLQFASYSFDASIGDIFTTILAGGCLCIPREEDRNPADITAFIAVSRANWAGITPSFASLLDPPSVPTLRALCMAGEPLPASQIEAWSHRLTLINMYGPSEATVACVANTKVSAKTSSSNIGTGYRTTTWIVDEKDHDQLVPIGAIGELLLEGPILVRGYLKRPEQTDKVFINSPPWLREKRPESRLYKTGDLVRYNSDGSMSFVGRKDTQIKINGQRVEIGEIEHALRASIEAPTDGPIIVDLLKRSHLDENDVLVAFICLNEEEKMVNGNGSRSLIATSEQSLARFRALVAKILDPHSAASSLPQYMTPQAFIPLALVPLTASGKADRRALQQVGANMSRNDLMAFALSSPSTSPSSFTSSVSDEVLEPAAESLEKLMMELWEKVLRVKGINTQANFFRLGGNSMSAIALRSEARRAGLDLSVADIFSHPVLADMAKIIPASRSSTPQSSPIQTPLSTSENGHSTPVQPSAALGPQIPLRLEDVDDACQEVGLSSGQVEDIFPCTPIQEALMVLSLHQERQGAYSIRAPFKLPEDLDRNRFQFAWETATLQYPILRSRIISRPRGGLVLIARDAIPVMQEKVSSLEEYLRDQRERNSFGYGSSLCRLSMVQDGQDNWYFVFHAHHSVYDGWSLNILWETVRGLYRGRNPPENAPSFHHFADQLNSTPKSVSADFWRQALKDDVEEEGFQFPMVSPTHNPIARSNKRFSFPFDSKLSTETGMTVGTLVQAAWAVVLSRYCAKKSVSFGMTLSGRDFPMENMEQVVGPTIATVPRSFNVAEGQSIAEFLQYIHTTNIASLSHQHFGLHNIQALGLVEKKACDFTSLLVVNSGEYLESSVDELGIQLVTLDQSDFHPYPLVVELYHGSKEIEAHIAFDPVCIDEFTLDHVMTQFNFTLREMIQGFFTSLTMTSLLMKVAPTHLEQMEEWNIRNEPFPNPENLLRVHQQVEAMARVLPSKLAVQSWDGSLSYAELDRCADALAQRILKIGLTSLDAPYIAICFEKSTVAEVCMLAVLKAGFAFLPLDPSQPRARLEGIIKEADARLILSSLTCQKIFEGLDLGSHVLQLEFSHLRTILDESSSTDALPQVSSNSPAYLLYTSGSTGKPKGVIIEHGSWSCAMAAHMDFWILNSDTRMLQFCNYTFDVSLFEIFGTWVSGGSLIVPSEQQRMDQIDDFVMSHDVNAIVLTPSVGRLLDPAKLHGVKMAALMGEPIAQTDIDAWIQPGRRVINGYGPTEACIFAASRLILREDLHQKVSNIGMPLGVNAWIVSPDQKALAPIGAVGELCLGGPTLARGYLKMPQRTAASFPEDVLDNVPGQKMGTRMYRTGDLARFAADGTLELLGRQDGQVKLRGQRIDVGEIEYHVHKVMSEIPAYRQAAIQLCKPTEGARCEPFLAALLVMDMDFDEEAHGVPFSSMTADSSEELSRMAKNLRGRLSNVLPAFMVPSAYLAVKRLPKTPSGKLDNGSVQALLSQVPSHLVQESSDQDVDLTPTELLLQDWWSFVLGLEEKRPGLDDDFLLMGGNSISAMRLAGFARSKGYKLGYQDILTFPVLSTMASHLTPMDLNTAVPSMGQSFDLLSPEETESLFESCLALYDISQDKIEDAFPCTPLQEALMASTAKYSGAYVMFEVFEVSRSQLGRLQKAWEAVFTAFELLRSRIIVTPERGAIQVVMKPGSGLEWKEVEDVDEFVSLAHDTIGYGKPLAFMGITKSSGEDLKMSVVFCAHHAAYDGLTLEMIRQKLRDEMSDERCNETIKSIPFKAFIQHCLAQDHSEAAAFWEQKLDGLSASAFPPRPRLRAPDTSHQPLASKSLSQRISLPTLEAQRKLGAMVSTVAHAAWALTISHYTGSLDSLFGVTLSGREAASDLADIDRIGGPTIATVPHRTLIDLESTVSDYLNGVQQDMFRAIRFAQMGLAKISRINEDCRQACQFDSLFVVQPPSSSSSSSSSSGVLHATELFFPYTTVVDVQIAKDGLMMDVVLNYDPTTLGLRVAQSILDTFGTILSNLLFAESDTKLGALSALSDYHVSELAKTGDRIGDPSSGASQKLLHALVREQVEADPFFTAVESWDGSMSYAELDDASSSLAEELRRSGVRPDKAVCIMFEKSKWAVVAMLAIVKAGGCFVPIDPDHPLARKKFIIETSRAAVMLVSARHAQSCELLPCKAIVVSDETVPAATIAFLKPPPLLPVPVKPNNAAYILFTSGSTGVPKGVVVEHGALCSSLVAIGRGMDIGSHSRVLQFNSYWFDVMLLDIFAPLAHGGCVCIPSEADRVNNLAGCIEEFQANTITLSTSVSRLIDPASVPSLKTVCLGGEAVLPSDVDRWAARTRLIAGYGPTEACIITVLGHLTPSTPSNFIGTPVETRAWVVNPLKEWELAPLGAVGELLIDGPNLAREYLGDAEKTAQSFIENPPWMAQTGAAKRRAYKTGDLVFFNEGGALNYVGRRESSQVKIRGHRVELAEIEETIRRCVPASVTVAVDVFSSDGDGSKKVLGAVLGVGGVSHGGVMDLLDGLRPRVKKTLPSHMVPRVYVPVDELPFLSTGKLDRKALQRTAGPAALSLANGTSSDWQAPNTEGEKLMSTLWAQVLNIQGTMIGRWDNFFSLGGDSMTAIRLVTLLRSHGHAATVTEVFRNPALADMAALMGTSQHDNLKMRETAEQCHDDDDQVYPLTPYQEVFTTGAMTYPGAHHTHLIFSLASTMDMDRLRAAVDSCMEWFPMLRAKMARDCATGKLSQAFLPVGTRASWSEWFTDDVEAVIVQESRHPMRLDSLMHRVSVVHGTAGSRLIWTLTHAVYDGWTMGMMLDYVEKRYQDASYQPPPSVLSFGAFLRTVSSAQADTSFWKGYLLSLQPKLLFNYASIKEPRQDRSKRYKITLPRAAKSSTTTSSTVLAGWILLLSETLHSKDIAIAHLVTGRTLPVAGIETCPGPTISKLPLRVRLQDTTSLSAVADLVSQSLMEVMPHQHTGLSAIRDHVPPREDGLHAGALLGRLPLDVAVHAEGMLEFEGGRGVGMVHERIRVMAPPPGGMSVECSLRKGEEGVGVDVWVVWDGRAAREEEVDGFVRRYDEILSH